MRGNKANFANYEANRKLGKLGSSLIWLLLTALSRIDCIEPPVHPSPYIMFLPGTRARYTRTGGGRVVARIIEKSPYGDEYRTIWYFRPSEDG